MPHELNDAHYFILKPRGNSPHANAARVAMIAYMRAIFDHDPELARALGEWVNREEALAEEGGDEQDRNWIHSA